MGLLSPQVSTKEMVLLCRQLATAYEAGIPILQSLNLVRRGGISGKLSRILERSATRIRQGATLSESLREESRYLPPFFVEVLAAGEQGGTLDAMLKDLADFYEDLLKLKQGVAVSMVYPGLQLAAAWFLGTFSLRLLPYIRGTGGRSFQFEAYLRDYLAFQARAGLVVLCAVIVVILLGRAGLLDKLTGFVKTFVWPFNQVSRRFGLSCFFRSMSLLVGAGMRMDRCIEHAARVTMNPLMERDLKRAIPLVMRGQTLVEAFSKVNCLSPVGRDMLAVGEQTGKLETSLRKVAEYHLEEARAAVAIATRVMNVLILLAVGAVVGYIVISFYGGLYSGLDTLT
ncbi:MAG TPA: type II secretion system F family protein [Candidatus Hydrogenedentes bacterium]|nr:type II secretion system F family protein [Candidatus Hydrogenedentota bacterium]HOJ67548.1 type II secretion system F family protein [Candidatus Hydrogenedentota bacterium]HOK89133.1 type II secretion system F family protein [Candidatus Hydrogenedentota bacterium]